MPEPVSSLLNLLLKSVQHSRHDHDLSLLLTHLPAPVAWLDAELKFRQVSRHFLALYGLVQEQVLGQSVSEVFPARGQLPGLLDRALRGQAVHLPLERLERGSGADQAVLWMRGEARPFFDAQGIGVLWTSQDASQERHLASQLDSLLDDSTALLAVMDGTGRVQNASSALMALVAMSQAEVLGMPLWEWPCWEHSGQIRELVMLASRGEPASTDVALLHGGLLRLSLHGEGQGAGLLVAQGHDLAPLRDMEEQAALQRSLIQQILARSSEATLLLNAAGRVTLVNEEAATLLGLEVSQLSGAPLDRLLREMGIQMYDVAGQQVLDLPIWTQSSLPTDREVLLVSAVGVRRTVRIQTSVLPVLEGQRHGLLMTLRDVSSLRRMEARLRHDTLHDGLTGLFNRAGMRSRLLELGQQTHVSLLAVDISGFPALTASLGRVPSDALLVQLAARLLTWREHLVAARLSDDTFILAYTPPLQFSGGSRGRDKPTPRKAVTLQAGAHVEEPFGGAPSTQLEEDLRSLQHHLQIPFTMAGRELPLNFNLGATSGVIGNDPEALLGEAETALHYIQRTTPGSRAVRAGGMIYHDALRSEVARDFQLQSELPGALERGELRLSYQPMVSLKDRTVLGAEALLRWNHPKLGLLAPPAFLPLASRSAIISDLGEWVVRRALEARAIWRQQGLDVPVSVNLSQDELLRQDDLERLFPLLEEYGAPNFELSADSLLHFSQRTLNLLTRLRELGASIVVDDFGDGASSLTSLERFPISGVKLHPSFVARLDNPRAYKLLQGTALLASSLGLSVTAVGVETAEQFALLEHAGVETAQGYYFAAPMTAGELSSFQMPQR
ncbi:EAL domain-containing protein [Deinococcus sp. KNUC1210]|uniref:sensor domain-containing protein n=1 Tax=Deinococcus sp. KNUC1210 TaxID=2917691 RepID=UPI001EEF9F0F|nr:EAL domain-containing protein [Deinococcus sp. KNUC1210]ULH15041.1 EAL domain-containing protein [Deinococcus sp. KNUC1210]